MKALRWHGKLLVRVEQVPDPKLEDPTDTIVKVKSSDICGSDLHLYGGAIDKFPMGAFFARAPTMRGGQAPVHKCQARLRQLILDHKIQPAEVVRRRIKRDEAPEHYRIFREKKRDCLKPVIHF